MRAGRGDLEHHLEVVLVQEAAVLVQEPGEHLRGEFQESQGNHIIEYGARFVLYFRVFPVVELDLGYT